MDLETNNSVLSMMLGSGPVVRAVLLLLIALSLASWTITIAKFLQLRRARSHTDEFSAIFWETRDFARVDDSSTRLAGSPLARLFHGGYRELAHILQESRGARRDVTGDLETIERAVRRAELAEAAKLEKGITFLATVASAAPFIGLFGTVWGIMTAFHGLSFAKNSTIQAVAPGISEALVATAIGLAAAIPAAVAYNYFAMSVRRIREGMDKFARDFLNVSRRYLST